MPVPLNTKLGPDALRYDIEDFWARSAPSLRLRLIADVSRVVSDLGLRLRVMLGAAGGGWLDYESELGSG